MAGREDYQARKDAKISNRRARAEHKRAESEAGVRRSADMLPDGGQPILVGHHSEAGHRRLLERSNNTMRSAVQAGRDAAELDQRADASENNTAISADDPEALPKLHAKLADMETLRERYKTFNKTARKAGTEQLPSYKLTNLGGNIRRVQLRIKELEAAEQSEIPDDVVVGKLRLHWDVDTNRVQLFSPRPAPEQRESRSSIMRGHGFIWARGEGCWQRQANTRGWRAGQLALEQLQQLDAHRAPTPEAGA